jgi:hypothetical protein
VAMAVGPHIVAGSAMGGVPRAVETVVTVGGLHEQAARARVGGRPRSSETWP